MGMRKETAGIDAYIAKTGYAVEQRNDQTLTVGIDIRGVEVLFRGRPDGVCVDLGAIVEHKYRPCGLIGRVPFHERVQCHVYMKMFGLRLAHLVETFNMHIQVHEVVFDEHVWSRICDAVVQKVGASDFTSQHKRSYTWKTYSPLASSMVPSESPRSVEPTSF